MTFAKTYNVERNFLQTSADLKSLLSIPGLIVKRDMVLWHWMGARTFLAIMCGSLVVSLFLFAMHAVISWEDLLVHVSFSVLQIVDISQRKNARQQIGFCKESRQFSLITPKKFLDSAKFHCSGWISDQFNQSFHFNQWHVVLKFRFFSLVFANKVVGNKSSNNVKSFSVLAEFWRTVISRVHTQKWFWCC